jgi:hypothetical protein
MRMGGVMNDQHKAVRTRYAQQGIDASNEQESADSAWLAIILEQLNLYFGSRAWPQDIEILGFSLHHLFHCVNILYEVALTDPIEPSEGQTSASITSIPPITKQAIPAEDLIYYHGIWTQLRSIKTTIERIDALCQLLNGALTGLLDAFDVCDNPYTSRSMIEQTTRLRPLHNSPVALENTSAAGASQQSWNHAHTVLTERLIDWQEYQDHYHTFTDQFSDLITTIPSLAQMERAFDFLLENIHTIFGEVLLDFQAVSTGDDDAAVATLLLDLMQKADLVLLHIDALLDPLRILIKHYTLEAEI